MGLENLGNQEFRIFLDFTNLPLKNYKQLFVSGQTAPDMGWEKRFDVVDDYPCYHFDFSWPKDGDDFEFSFGVVKEDSSEEWVDPTQSDFECNGHLCFNPNDY